MSALSVGKLLEVNFNIIQEFESYLKNETSVAESSIKKYIGDVKRFEEYVNTIGGDIKNITRSDVQDYMNKLVKENKSASTIDRNFRSIKRFGDYTGAEAIAFKDLKKPKKPQLMDGEIRSMDEKTVKSLIRIAEQTKDIRTVTIVKVLYYTGVRVHELVNINIENIDLNKGGSLRVLGKGGKERKIPLGNEVKIYLEKYIESQGNPEEGPLFPSRQAKRMNTKTVDRTLNKIEALYNLNKKKTEKIHLTAHMFRHTCCRRLLDIGFDVTQVCKIMGHSSIEVTGRYAMKSVEESADLIDLM